MLKIIIDCCRVSFNSINMDIVVNAGGQWFEHAEMHYLPIYALRMGSK